MRPFPAALMRMWPISTRVNKPENDDPSTVGPVELATDTAYQFANDRGSDGFYCPVCGLGERITKRAGGYYRCNQCKEDFTVLSAPH